jgi:hypothetical protein
MVSGLKVEGLKFEVRSSVLNAELLGWENDRWGERVRSGRFNGFPNH